jgi:hypothetical protein
MKDWVLIDTDSTVNVFCNKSLIVNIRPAETLHVQTNAGQFSTSYKADLPWCNMEVWYDPKAITNVLSFAIVQAMFLVKYDNRIKDAIYVETPRGMIEFNQLSKNLYIYTNPKLKKPAIKQPSN